MMVHPAARWQMKLIERIKMFHERQLRRRARVRAFLERRAQQPAPKAPPELET